MPLIRGAFTQSIRPFAPVRLRGPTGVELEVSALIDTGFHGFVALPEELVTELKLELETTSALKLGDASEVTIGVYTVEVAVGTSWVAVTTYEVGDEPLLGMRLFRGYKLTLDVAPYGSIESVPLG